MVRGSAVRRLCVVHGLDDPQRLTVLERLQAAGTAIEGDIMEHCPDGASRAIRMAAALPRAAGSINVFRVHEQVVAVFRDFTSGFVAIRDKGA